MNMTEKLADTVRMLAADTIQKANSGHPGMPLGTADYAVALWANHMQFNPEDPRWLNRDRFVLSAGHGSALLYSLLHLFGYDVTMEDLKSFRQWGSRTAGHPEYGHLPGVESTTGPLGQGFAMGVGMAAAAKMAQAKFNKEHYPLIDHHIYSIAGDGCMMEGIASEAASLAGHLKLDNIIYFYDSNRITIEGSTDLAFSEDVAQRFQSYNWQVWDIDGHNYEEIEQAVAEAKSFKGKPKLIICRTHIAYKTPHMQDKSASHGSPLGEEEIRETKKILGLPEDEKFYIPRDAAAFARERVEKKKEQWKKWQEMYKAWQRQYPELSRELDACMEKPVPEDLFRQLTAELPDKDEATRVSSGAIIQKLAKLTPFITGGSADLEPSVKALIKGDRSVSAEDFSGRNLHFGIREHAMGAVMNGIALYGLAIPYGATFLVFSDYMRPTIRLSALMKIQTLYIYTHDSVFLGEDGPTHQPVEQLGSLRIMPNLQVIRPADAFETAAAWDMALRKKDGPTALILSRQNVPQLKRENGEHVMKGAYAVKDCTEPDVILLASGSEVHTALGAAEILERSSVKCRVVSVPCLEVFSKQNENYQESLIPKGFEKVAALEASLTRDWDRYVSKGGLFIGLDDFGHSAPAKVLAEKYGFTPEAVAEKIQNTLLR